MFRVLVQERHSKWAYYLKLIEECINTTYHETIQTTSYEAQWKEKPKREWSQHIDEVLYQDDEIIDQNKMYLRIKEKVLKRAEKVNTQHRPIQYQVGDKVLVRTNPTSDLNNKIISKFCALFEGPYRIGKQLGPATYTLHDLEGNFNTLMLKPYIEIVLIIESLTGE